MEEAQRDVSLKAVVKRVEVHRRLARERLVVGAPVASYPPSKIEIPITNMDDEMVSDNFEVSFENDLIIHCNIVLVLPRECDYFFEVS